MRFRTRGGQTYSLSESYDRARDNRASAPRNKETPCPQDLRRLGNPQALVVMEAPDSVDEYVLCVNDGGYPESLEVRKLYAVLPDERAAADDYIRVIDETGEDYLYPAKYFVPIQLPPEVAKILPVGSALRNGRPR
jgi:hypothetical protein